MPILRFCHFGRNRKNANFRIRDSHLGRRKFSPTAKSSIPRPELLHFSSKNSSKRKFKIKKKFFFSSKKNFFFQPTCGTGVRAASRAPRVRNNLKLIIFAAQRAHFRGAFAREIWKFSKNRRPYFRRSRPKIFKIKKKTFKRFTTLARSAENGK